MPASTRSAIGLLSQAQQLQQRGRLQEATELCQRVLAATPDDPEANHLFGLLLHQAGRNAEAAERIGKAVRHAPANATYHSNLGVVLKEAGRLDEAVVSYEAALGIDPDLAATHSNLGVALLALGRVDDAIDAQRQALALAPDYPEARANLGLALAQQPGRMEEAVQSFQRAIELKPDYANAHNHLATAFKALRRFDEAEASCRRAIALRPSMAAAHYNLGGILVESGRLDKAVESYRRAIKVRPDSNAYRRLGQTLNDMGQYAEAAKALSAGIAIDPEDEEAYTTLGWVLVAFGKAFRAIECFRHALALRPDRASARHGLAASLRIAGFLEEAIAEYRKVLILDGDWFSVRSGVILAGNYLESVSTAELVAEARAFGTLVAQKTTARCIHSNRPDPTRRLKVGLVSADLRYHAVARFLESVLGAIDREKIELFAYSTSAESDEMTERLKLRIPNWRNMSLSSDDVFDAKVVEDQIDILVDLSGHTPRNRLTMFAKKPAPIAATWLGYFATTGLKAIDYVIANRFVIPKDEEDQWVETPWRLPETYLCFSPPSVAVPLAPPPCIDNGRVTFGCANNLNKLSDGTVAVWAQILTAVPNSRLSLRSAPLADSIIAERTRTRFAAHGVDLDRIELEPAIRDYGQHLAAYNRVDIALDPFPYAGGTTTVESLWMGVPVLTLKGDRYVAHMGENILHHMEMQDWIAETTDQYVSKAVAFADDPDALSDLRAKLRDRLVVSPLCDASRFARHFEQALQGMWKIWCESQLHRVEATQDLGNRGRLSADIKSRDRL